MASDTDLGPLLSGRLVVLLKRTTLGLADLHAELLAPLGITDHELSLLLFLGAGEPESQQEAARRLGVDRTTMVALIDALEAKALVARRPDPADRRRNVVELTKTGREVLRDATRASDEAEQRLLGALDDSEAAQLRSLLRRIAVPR
jgi:DNA-binding MarR family transcriptional regulator